MTLCSPAPHDRSRLRQMLWDYDRDEFWLRVNHVFHLECQSDQISFDVVDADGVLITDRHQLRMHSSTWQSCPPWVSVVPGQLVHVVKSGDDVAVRILPLIVESEPRYEMGEYGHDPVELLEA